MAIFGEVGQLTSPLEGVTNAIAKFFGGDKLVGGVDKALDGDLAGGAILIGLAAAENSPVGKVGKITGYTKHGLNQAISRDGVGVATKAILAAVKNPRRVIEQADGKMKYVGENATVILNRAGEVVTTWARNSAGWRIPQ